MPEPRPLTKQEGLVSVYRFLLGLRLHCQADPDTWNNATDTLKTYLTMVDAEWTTMGA